MPPAGVAGFEPDGHAGDVALEVVDHLAEEAASAALHRRVRAAFARRAISRRRFGLNFAARARPPFAAFTERRAW